MLLSREQILAQSIPTERVKLPWIDGESEVIVRAFPAHIIERLSRADASENSLALGFVYAVIDEKGNRILTDEDAKSLPETVDPSLLQIVNGVAWRLSVPTKERAELIKKNSPASSTDGSGESPSP